MRQFSKPSWFLRHSLWKLWALLPLAYIVFWFYLLITWAIPALSVPIKDIVNATWWQGISMVLFWIGVVPLFFAFVAFYFILTGDDHT